MVKKIWFRAKPYGAGWYPATWEGCFVLLLYLILLVASILFFDSKSHSVSDTLFAILPSFVVLTLALLFIAWWKGESFGWRWGNKR
jgi:hypothetical protein